MATHSSILAWSIAWTEEPDGLQSKGSQRVRHNRVTNTERWAHLQSGSEAAGDGGDLGTLGGTSGGCGFRSETGVGGD